MPTTPISCKQMTAHAQWRKLLLSLSICDIAHTRKVSSKTNIKVVKTDGKNSKT